MRAVQRYAAALLTAWSIGCTDTAPSAPATAGRPSAPDSTQPNALGSAPASMATGAGSAGVLQKPAPALMQPATSTETPGTPELASGDVAGGIANPEPEPAAARHIEIVGRQLRV